MSNTQNPLNVPGTKLSPEDQQYVLAAFVHRHTRNHIPSWVSKAREDGCIYPPQFGDDYDWLANTLFVVKPDGSLDRSEKFCESHPTWPDNPELRSAGLKSIRVPAEKAIPKEPEPTVRIPVSEYNAYLKVVESADILSAQVEQCILRRSIGCKVIQYNTRIKLIKSLADLAAIRNQK